MEELWRLWRKGYTYKTGIGAIRKADPIYISNMGNIRGRKLDIDVNGYLTFCYKHRQYKMHRAVAELFIPNSDRKKCIDHINTVKTDNRVENLRWCSQKENLNNPLTIKKYKQSNAKNARISAKKCSKAVKCVETGEIFNSARDADRHYNLSFSSVCNAANPKHPHHTAGGYHWQYI